MTSDVFTYIVGGKAGEGVKKAGTTAANMFSTMGRHVFQMDDYPSLIRGGHNFSVVSTSTREVTSHYMAANLVVALDERSYETHRSHVADGGVMVFNSDTVKEGAGIGVSMSTEAARYPNAALRVGVSGIAALCAAMGQSKQDLADTITAEYRHDLENNIAFAGAIYDEVLEKSGAKFTLERGVEAKRMFTGNEAIALGAAAAGLDMYFGYPMTPASTVLHYLAGHDRELGVTVVHPESEIAVANMAIGAAAAGARVMVGTSGGGFALMEEAFSFAGMAEVPFLSVLSSRPGPGTGVPTYTEQADLRFALGQGHGDFPRIIASPGTVSEAFTLAAEMMALVWTYQTTGILLTEKHLSESRVTAEFDLEGAAWAEPTMHAEGHAGGEYRRYLKTDDGVSPLLFPPSAGSIKWSSYEHDEAGITTEEAGDIAAMHDKRDRKRPALIEKLKGIRTVNRYGADGPVVLAYGSNAAQVRG
ncbi:MAG: 2-oxoacid:acceptor oxidoreductase subunit alpha [Tenericutes bacterium]|nr:MAG: 2-oxoacid:acceptor oxidoreductase subunit alpha [Mycoplasmatota bacterium]